MYNGPVLVLPIFNPPAWTGGTQRGIAEVMGNAFGVAVVGVNSEKGYIVFKIKASLIYNVVSIMFWFYKLGSST